MCDELQANYRHTRFSLTMIVDLQDGTTKAQTIEINADRLSSIEHAEYKRTIVNLLTATFDRLYVSWLNSAPSEDA